MNKKVPQMRSKQGKKEWEAERSAVIQMFGMWQAVSK